MNKDDEMVLVTFTKKLFSGCPRINGLLVDPVSMNHIMKCIQEESYFSPRRNCETDPTFKQIIPYCIITAGDKVFVTRRKEGGAEERLHNKYSLGIGGHINPIYTTDDVTEMLRLNLLREISEEVFISGPLPDPELIGVLNDDSNPVGEVHLGLVYRLNLQPWQTVTVRETDQLDGKFMKIEDTVDIDNWETWSKICLKDYLLQTGDPSTPTASKVIVINGNARSGKDSFCRFLSENWQAATFTLSTVSTVKKAAEFFGADENIQKTDAERKLWSTMKDAWTEYNDGPFNEITQKIEAFRKMGGPDVIIFIHVREPDEISKIKVKYGDQCSTVLIRRPGAHTPQNHADMEVENFPYDCIIENNGSLENLKQAAITFLSN